MDSDRDKILQEYWLTDFANDDSDSSSCSEDTVDHLIDIAAIFVGLVMENTLSYARTLYDKTPYHTSALTGEMWVLELIHGHSERIRNELGVHKHVFLGLCNDLRQYGHRNSKHVTLEEQLAMFLYTCVTGLSIRHVSERFQRATDTTSQ
jgi:hypothetical protein